jgi:hypothetical protein
VLHCLLLEELAVFALGDDFYCIILGCGLVESVSKCLAYDRVP